MTSTLPDFEAFALFAYLVPVVEEHRYSKAGKEAAGETAVGCGSIFHLHRILLIKHHYLSLSLGRHSTIRLSLGVDLDWSKRTYLNCRSPVSQIPPMLSQDLVLCVFVQTRRRRSVGGAYLTGFFPVWKRCGMVTLSTRNN